MRLKVISREEQICRRAHCERLRVDPADIQSLLENHIDGCNAHVRIEGSHIHAVVISDKFEGLNTLKRQQMVYGALNAAIAEGRIHAVHMKTFTPTEWQSQAG